MSGEVPSCFYDFIVAVYLQMAGYKFPQVVETRQRSQLSRKLLRLLQVFGKNFNAVKYNATCA